MNIKLIKYYKILLFLINSFDNNIWVNIPVFDAFQLINFMRYMINMPVIKIAFSC